MTIQEVQKILESGRLREVHEAVNLERRHRLHSRKDQELTNPAYDRWLEIPRVILPEDKYRTFRSLITTPLPTVPVTDAAYIELKRIFDGQNRVEEFYFNSDELEQDFYSYRKQLKEPGFWAGPGWDLFKNNICCVIAIDLPALQVTEHPTPYFFPVYTEHIYQIVNDIHNNCLFLAYEIKPIDPEDEEVQLTLAVYCDEYYRVMQQRQAAWVMVSESYHGLMYVPARQFYSTPLDDSAMLKANPVTESLGDLDWLLFSQITERHLELYAGYPIISFYEQECDYVTEDGVACEKGILHNIRQFGGVDKEVNTICPKCQGKQFVGPGSMLSVPPPLDSGDPKNMPGLDITEGDTASLKEVKEKIERQIKNFMINTVGYGGEPKNESAKNEKQIESNFESRLNVLIDVKTNFEDIQKFTLNTIARLRYGLEYIACSLSYGTKFYLQTETEIQKNYTLAKANGMPVSELAAQRQSLFTKKYSNNPDQLKRILIMEEVEPYPDYSVGELSSMQFVDPEKLRLKVSLNDLVQRFERQYGDIVMFMAGITYSEKIDFINKTFEKWLKEETSTMQLIQESVQRALDSRTTT